MAKENVSVLLVDDDEDDYLLTSDTLESIQSFDFNISWAASYQEAVRLIGTKHFDLFVFDFFLGQKTGLELAKAVIDEKILTPIILLTGVGDKHVDEQASDLGVYDYLVKNDIDTVTLERSIRYTIKQAQIRQELKKSEFKYRSVIEHSHDIIFISDIHFKLMSLSNSVLEITGFSQAELEGKSLLKLVSDKEDVEFIRAELKEKGSIINYPISLLTNTEDKKYAMLSCSIHQDGFGKEFLHGTIIDKTNEHKAEKARLLTEKMEATSRLMRTLAHEVRNPLSSISLSIESIEAEFEGDDCEAYLKIIKRNTGRIDEIITKVLNSARIKTIETENLPVQLVINAAVESISDRASLKNIQIVVDLSEEPYFLPINTEQLEIAFTNIFVNAIEAMEDISDAKLDVTLDQRIIKISDNGIGIPEEQQNHLFEPYFTTKQNGVGLGLASTLSILKAHQIEVDVQSTVGKGTSFTLLLPNNERAK